MKPVLTMMTAMAIAMAVATPVLAQSKALAGTWALDAEKSVPKQGPPLVVLTLTAKEFTARLGSATAREMKFTLDGKETEPIPGVKTKAVWKGAKLEATVTTPNGPETITFSREGAWMVMEGKNAQGPMKFFFKKAPAK